MLGVYIAWLQDCWMFLRNFPEMYVEGLNWPEVGNLLCTDLVCLLYYIRVNWNTGGVLFSYDSKITWMGWRTSIITLFEVNFLLLVYTSSCHVPLTRIKQGDKSHPNLHTTRIFTSGSSMYSNLRSTSPQGIDSMELSYPKSSLYQFTRLLQPWSLHARSPWMLTSMVTILAVQE